MKALLGMRSFTLAALCILCVLTSAHEVIFPSQRAGFRASFQEIWSVVFALLVASWATADAQSRSCQRSFDFGFFIMSWWPLTLPFYLIRTRGIRGLGPFVGLTLIYAVPLAAAYLAAWLGAR